MTDPAHSCPDRPAVDPQADLLIRDFTLDTLVTVRHDVQSYAARHGLADLALYRFVVAVNELTTNAVRHGGGRGHLALWRIGNRLHCRVTDHGTGLPTQHRFHRPPAQAAGGRGLWLARHGADRLTIDSDAGGTGITVSARLGTVKPTV